MVHSATILSIDLSHLQGTSLIPPKVQSSTFTSVMWPLASQALSSLQVLVPLWESSRGVVQHSRGK